MQDASKQYSDCAIGRAVQMARVSEEPAETIARAALGGCALLRQQYLAVVAQELGIIMTPERAETQRKKKRRLERSSAMSSPPAPPKGRRRPMTAEPAPGLQLGARAA